MTDPRVDAIAKAIDEHHYDSLQQWVRDTGQMPPRKSFCEQMGWIAVVVIDQMNVPSERCGVCQEPIVPPDTLAEHVDRYHWIDHG